MAPTFTAGQILRLRDGEIRIDRVTDDWIYFVQFSRIAETGAPTRMAPTLFAEAVAMQTLADLLPDDLRATVTEFAAAFRDNDPRASERREIARANLYAAVLRLADSIATTGA